MAFYRMGVKRVGAVEGDQVYDISEPLIKSGLRASGVDELLRLVDPEQVDVLLQEAPVVGRAGEVRPEKPIDNPEKILLAAVNYRSHEKEQGATRPERPYLFCKFRSALNGPYDDVIIPRSSNAVDYEGELALVIGRKGKYIDPSKALEHVAGFMIADDVSFRDLQFPPGWPERLNPYGQNWVMGKALDTAMPIGPWIITKDEIGDIYGLSIRTRVNGELRQDGLTSDMIFRIEELISHASQGITLAPGDIISTGTPQGVAAFTGKRYLAPGDVVEVEISGIGRISNRFVAEGDEGNKG